MGTDPRDAVVDVDGEVFGHRGLYVLDGAALPGATGGNPSMTIAAVAERCISVAIRRITGDEAWQAPERRDAVRGAVPEDAAVDLVRRARPLERVRPGVVFRERMGGDLGGRRAEMRLTVNVKDLAAFLADRAHRADVSGTVTVAGLTAGPAAVRGEMRVLERGPSGGRSMSYHLPFRDGDGQEWLLAGRKDVGRPHHPWHAVTRMPTSVTRRAAAEGSAPSDVRAGRDAGQVAISTTGVLALVASARATGVRRAGRFATWAAKVRVLVTFGLFFVSRVARAYRRG